QFPTSLDNCPTSLDRYVIPNEVRNLVRVPFGRGQRFLATLGMTSQKLAENFCRTVLPGQ
ncbi:MAG: hypothetical protein ACPGWR_27670, partial [Ardenticatenaceae bacterium]